MSFNPNEHLRKLGKGDKAQDYLDVKWRLVWFREKYPHGSITTEELAYDLDREVTSEERVWNNTTRQMEPIIKRAFGYARYRAIVEDGEGGHATGTKSENAASFPDFGEKAETGAIGRALAALGFGTQFAPEMDEEHRIVDAPVDRTPTPSSPEPRSTAQPAKPSSKTPTPINAASASPQAQMIAALLEEFRQLFPGWCQKTPDWQEKYIRQVLPEIPASSPLPAEYSPDDVIRLELDIKTKRAEKQQQKSA